jgi:hypothetical protein
MKQAINIMFALSLLMGPVGCQSSTTAYKTLGGIGFTVDGAMTAYSDAVVSGVVSEQDQAKVRILHGKYRPVYEAAVRAASQDLSTLAPEELSAIAAELTILILSITN